MKKVLSSILVLTMMLSLCACGNSNKDAAINNSDIIANTTEDKTGDATESTQNFNTESTIPTDTSTPNLSEDLTTKPTNTVEAPTTKPTKAPTPTPTTPAACNHNWKTATCTAPKTCSKCSATEGKALGHSWKNATCTTPKNCSTCGATNGQAAGHNFYAGECTHCKEADNAMVRIYSADKLFSIALPRSWSTYEVSGSGLGPGPYGNQATLTITSTKFSYGWLMLPVFRFIVVERGVDFNGYDSSAGRHKFLLITSNNNYDVYMETVLETGIHDPNNDEPVSGTTDADLQELKKIIIMQDEIKDSFRWE